MRKSGLRSPTSWAICFSICRNSLSKPLLTSSSTMNLPPSAGPIHRSFSVTSSVSIMFSSLMAIRCRAATRSMRCAYPFCIASLMASSFKTLGTMSYFFRYRAKLFQLQMGQPLRRSRSSISRLLHPSQIHSIILARCSSSYKVTPWGFPVLRLCPRIILASGPKPGSESKSSISNDSSGVSAFFGTIILGSSGNIDGRLGRLGVVGGLGIVGGSFMGSSLGSSFVGTRCCVVQQNV